MDSTELVDIREAQRLTGLDKSTLYKLARTGRLRSFKVLSALRFSRSDLTALVVERAFQWRRSAVGSHVAKKNEAGSAATETGLEGLKL